MAKKGGSPMLGDEKAPSVPKLGMPSGNQNVNPECGYVGGGSADLESETLTSGPSDISGGH